MFLQRETEQTNFSHTFSGVATINTGLNQCSRILFQQTFSQEAMDPELVGLWLTGGLEDRLGFLRETDSRDADAAHHPPVLAADVLLALQEEPHERTDGLPAEGLPGALLLHQLSHHIPPCSQRAFEGLPQLPKVSSRDDHPDNHPVTSG